MSSKTKVTPIPIPIPVPVIPVLAGEEVTFTPKSAVLVHPAVPVLEVTETVTTTTTTTTYFPPESSTRPASSSNTEIDLDEDDHEQLRTLSSVKSWSLPGSHNYGKFALFITGKKCQVWVIEDNKVIGMTHNCFAVARTTGGRIRHCCIHGQRYSTLHKQTTKIERI